MTDIAIAINCVDGRVQVPVLEWMYQHVNAIPVHNVTEPGPDGSLAKGIGSERIESIVRLLATRGPVKLIGVVSHHDCLGNPVDEETHKDHLRKAVEVAWSWKISERVVGLWVNHEWRSTLVYEAGI